MILLLSLLSCGTPPETATPPTPPVQLIPLDGPALVRRLSLDLRGVLPSLDEIARAEADPEAWRTIRDEYLEDPLFEERLVQLLAERWHTRVDVFDIVYSDYHLEAQQEYAFERSVGEEPLRLMAHVITNDLPWTDTVTADYTMANDLLASIWPLDYPDGATGWQPATYTDGRPGVGILSTNGLWWRYTTNNSNMNRSRAAAISRLLLCEDFLARPVTFSANDSDLSDLTNAITTNPYCVACHASLDPLASSMFGFWWVVIYSRVEDTNYHPERENLGQVYLGVDPSWFGEPMSGLSEMGYKIATDSRFFSCTVRSFAEQLWRRDAELSDFGALEDLRQTFLESDARVKPLIAAITDTDIYRAGGATAEASEETLAQEQTARMLSPAQLDSILVDLTGFRWTWEGYDLLDNDTWGFRVLGGGVDGVNVSRPQQDPGLTWALVFKRAAQGAAMTVVRDELIEGEPRRLFTAVTLENRPGDPEFTAELESLHRRLVARPADAAWLSEVEALWTAVEAESDAATAWASVVSTALRDPAFVVY